MKISLWFNLNRNFNHTCRISAT